VRDADLDPPAADHDRPRTDTRRVTMSGPGRTCSTAWLYGFKRDRNDEPCFAASSPSWARQHFSTPSGQRLTGPGQIFRVVMYHENHPDGSYEMANLVVAFEAPRAIRGSRLCVTGTRKAGVRRLDLGLPPDQLGPDETKVTLSYDWSAVGPITRQHIQFPPFPPDHLDSSLSHLAAIVAR
jgi:hypothetical protein